MITLAVREYDNTVDVTKNGKSYVNDAPSKLQARRQMMAYLYNVPEPKGEKESKADYKERTGDVNFPVVEKLFREIGPRYAKRAQDLGQGGGYTRIIKTGPRRGDAAPMAHFGIGLKQVPKGGVVDSPFFKVGGRHGIRSAMLGSWICLR